VYTTSSCATRKTGLRAWSVFSLLAVIAAVSACSASGGTVEQRQPGGKSVPRQNTPGENRTGSGRGENESGHDENEGGGNEA
jgi:hypothetical protein